MSAKIISFSYTPFEIPGKEVKFRPVVEISISYQNIIFPSVEALVDSGSDRNLFPAWMGERMGISFNRDNYKIIYGIGGIQIRAYTAKVKLHLYKFTFETEIVFSHEHNIPLLGRDGFFNLFKSVKFREKENFLDIEL